MTEEKAAISSNTHDIFAGGGQMGALMRDSFGDAPRSHNWSQTTLGSISQWAQSLRTAVNICLNTRFPTIVWWGMEFTLLYNDAWRSILGSKHPHALGKPGREGWPELWDTIGAQLEQVLATGQGTGSDRVLLLVDRHGYAEEAYFTYSHSPIFLETGEVGGVFTVVTETTPQEQALRLEAQTAKANLETILSSISDVFVVLDRDWRYTYVNAKAVESSGRSKEDFLGKTIWEFFPDAVGTLFYTELHRAVAEQTPVQFEFFYPGWNRWYENRVYPSQTGVSLFTADITERKQAERRLTAQYAVTQVLAEAVTLADAVPAILQSLCESLEWQLGTIWSIDRHTNRLHYVNSWQSSGIDAREFIETNQQTTFASGIDLPGRVWSSRQPIWISDLTKDTNFPRAAAAARGGLHAVFGFPILLGDEILGVIECFSDRIQEPDEDLLQMMLAIGTQIGQFMERKRTEAALRESEARFRLMAETIEDVFWVTDFRVPQILYVSPAYEQIWGRSRDELYRDYATWLETIHPEDRERVQAVASTCQHKDFVDNEYRIVRPDGSIRWIHDRGFAIRDQAGQIYQVVGVAQDITDYKRTEEALRESEERFRVLADSAPVMIWVNGADGGCEFVNNAYLEFFGKTLEEVTGFGWCPYLHPDDEEDYVSAFLAAMANRQPFRAQFRAMRADGQYRWLESYALPRFSASGEFLGYVGSSPDITEIKYAEAALRQSEARFRRIFECKMVPMGIWSGSGIVEANDALLDLIGYTRQELETGLIDWRELTPPEHLPADDRSVAEIAARGFSTPYEKEYIHKQGHRIPILMGGASFLDDPESGVFFAVNLTERKRMESALRQSEERLRSALQAGRMVAWAWDAKTDIIVRSETACEVMGISPDALQGTGSQGWLLVYPDDLAHHQATVQEAINAKSSYKSEFRMIRPDNGALVWIEDRGKVNFDAMGNLVSIEGTLFDISDRKQAEESLRRSEERFRITQEISLDAFTILRSVRDETGQIVDFEWTYVNPKAAEILRQPVEALVGQRLLQVLPGNKTNSELFERYVRVVETGEPHDIELFYNSEGITGWFRNMAVKLADGVAISFSDITERRQMEEALRQSEERLRVALKNSPVTVFNQDRELRYTWVYNPTLEYHATEVIGKQDVDLLPSNDAAALTQIKRRVLETGVGARQEVKLTMQGQDYYYDLTVEPLRDTDGEIMGVTCASINITDQKQAELALRRSETILNAFLASSPIGMAFLDRDLRYIYINEALAAINGLPLSVHLGHTLWDVLPEWAPQFAPMLQQIMQTKEPVLNCEVSSETNPLGVYWYCLVNYFPVCLPDGQVLGVGVTLMDISDRKRAEQALQESEERLRFALEGAELGTWDYDIASGQIFWSERSKTIFGVAPDADVDYQVFINTVHPEDRERIDAAVERAIANREDYDVEMRCQWADGTVRWIRSIGRAQYNPEGRPTRMIGVAFDITDRKQAEQIREQLLERERTAREEAETANRIKDEFLAVLSHELRSPLNPILGWAKLLQSRKIDETLLKKALETIERNARLQAQLIEDLLDVSRILQGKLSLNMAPVNLVTTIEAAMETVRLAAEAKTIRIQTMLDPDVGGVLGDAARLQQVVWNLLSNAVKFTPPGGKVNVRLECIDSQAQIAVSDTGKGIKADFLPHVFEYFRQADSTTTRKFGGLGLGLAIVRHLVEMHGGTVWAESPGEGQGATFAVKLPLIKEGLTSTEEINAAPSTAAPVSLPLLGVQILIVDDDADTRDFFAFALEQLGANVTAVASAWEALQALTLAKPDVLLSDIGMPEMDGYMLMRQVRTIEAEQGKQQIPAIALTAYAGEINQQQALRAGFQMHIAKPVSPEELLRAISNLIKRN
ncbi:PAS domain S-box protein [Fischerella sp. PCC 9605]|uniref:PAS domain S-box protein n=1 Tax=Fischerella sp. PCC 9605 TaxID=1173024 RepID=UPI0004B6F2B2|nr:PAS domain S-box protein [Fischerella sp. PCC 9605]